MENKRPLLVLIYLAITVADMDVTLDFYKRVLGAHTHFEDLFRKGEIPVVLLQVGASRISVHQADSPAAPASAASRARPTARYM